MFIIWQLLEMTSIQKNPQAAYIEPEPDATNEK
jgi:hypothetical protein